MRVRVMALARIAGGNVYGAGRTGLLCAGEDGADVGCVGGGDGCARAVAAPLIRRRARKRIRNRARVGEGMGRPIYI